MMRDHLNRALVLSAGLFMAAAASAQTPAANAAPQAQDAPGKQKADDNKGKNDVKVDPNAAGAPGAKTDTKADPNAKDDPAQKGLDRAARLKSQHDAERAKLVTVLHGPMDDVMREELKRHARRTARLERIKALATEAKDKDAIDRASKLLDKESARHDKWMTNFAATAANVADPKAGGR